MEEAGRLGFPSFELEVEIEGVSWDESVYTGLRKFHQAKGFDPDSQNIALELGYPLFEISTDVDGTSAHGELRNHLSTVMYLNAEQFSRPKQDCKMMGACLKKKPTNTLVSRLFERDPKQWQNHPLPGRLLWACSFLSCLPSARFGCMIFSTSSMGRYSRAGLQSGSGLFPQDFG
ncbi:hypothetical protein B0H17DRAFT_1020974 [Mycena rosella]|uniref:Uncharacterized protein n=1 Tax=Mycena rosella TaxID=1033263 RepID=A0AAD7CQY8_MYCRO|nr:hypothetical protein B0H17DRAFT_1020974 [Mycena rosella]